MRRFPVIAMAFAAVLAAGCEASSGGGGNDTSVPPDNAKAPELGIDTDVAYLPDALEAEAPADPDAAETDASVEPDPAAEATPPDPGPEATPPDPGPEATPPDPGPEATPPDPGPETPVGPSGHTEDVGGVMHKPGKENALVNCTSCHGAKLDGGSSGQSCYECHDNSDHTKNKKGFMHLSGSNSVCKACHGPSNNGGLGPACSNCH